MAIYGVYQGLRKGSGNHYATGIHGSIITKKGEKTCGDKKIIPIFATKTKVKNEGMKPKDLKKAITLCETFKEDFIEKWHEHMDDNE